MRSSTVRRGAAVALALLLSAAGGLAAQTTAASSAFGESIHLQLKSPNGRLNAVDSGPQPLLAGTAAPAFNLSGRRPSLSVTAPQLGRVLDIGAFSVQASSGVPSSDTAAARATVEDLTFDLARHLVVLEADALRSTAGFSGSCAGGLVPAGTTTLVGARLLGFRLAASPAPNTVLVSLPWVRLVLNEQIASNAAGVSALTVNAFHLSLAALPLLGLGTLSGDVVLAQSHAEIHCNQGAADLNLNHYGYPNPIAMGGVLTYALSVGNAGPDAAPGTIVTEPLPAGVTFLAAQTSQGSCSGTTTVTCDLGTLAPGDPVYVSIAVSTDQPGALTNLATVASNLPDPNPVDNSMLASVSVLASGPTELVAPAPERRSGSVPPPL
ncbi:MAG TPA: DUF11 domain-containing protein [Thermoanaerobaculia bacterium]|nr:DUF11 domain-containing protein [Thermoanaerobaculia bacterium]